ncbi:hypothetical protein NP572_19655 [Pseudomonas putida]|uniref:DUF6694 family lipoprotein n=1 Tax=Pseudomonas putida TaxID=303 RepID=UPI0023638A16|nr:DUF6694 family lipoprotein [Pseudomonas putida]MDD2038720.1 hypothetical protein [Pseudomonas putida]MDD2044335.1 hypothetical protein [Pseudomonas putida]
MKLKMTLLAASFVLLAGCGDDKIDGSTEAKFTSSLTDISQNIEMSKKAAFDEAVSFIETQFGKDRASYAQALNGKDADEVVALGAEMRKAAHDKAIEQAKAELQRQINDLQARSDEAQAKYDQEVSNRAQTDDPSKLEILLRESVEVHQAKIERLKNISPEDYLAGKK